jgi:hypothetical protein
LQFVEFDPLNGYIGGDFEYRGKLSCKKILGIRNILFSRNLLGLGFLTKGLTAAIFSNKSFFIRLKRDVASLVPIFEKNGSGLKNFTWGRSNRARAFFEHTGLV